MSNYQNSITGKILSGFISLTTALWLSGAIMMMPAAIAKADAASDLQAQISALLAQINQLQSQLTAAQGGQAGLSHVFNANLSFGAKNDEVTALQQALNLQGCFTATATGYFGSITREAVKCFQQKYASEVLTPLGLTSATGFVGAGTRAKLNALYGGVAVTPTTPTTPVTPTTVVAGAGLAVESGVQPAASLAVNNASRVPYTILKLTAGSSDVTVKSITVERTGLANDAVFAGIVVLDEDNTQITGVAKTLNSVHQAVLNDAFTVKAGTSKIVTLAGNMASSLTSYAGQVAYLSVVAIDASGATVTGTLPITGAGHTINSSLSIGTATLTRGTLDPGVAPTKSVGTTAYVFTSIKVTAGSAEDALLEQVRFNQAGSITSSDLKNIKIEVDGTSYEPTVSSDSKYYTAKFGAGITIGKGLNKDVLIKGDIVSGSGRTVDFNLWQYQDIVVKGKTYGYYITPTSANDGTANGQFSTTTNPRYNAYAVTVGSGALVVSNSSTVPAAKIANGGTGMPLGAFLFDVTGEEISFTSWALTIATSGGGSDELLTNITVYDQNGAVVAGPQDPNSAGSTATISTTVTLPVGKNTLTVKGNLNSSWETSDTIQVSFTPSSALSSVLGVTTGQSVTPSPSSSVAGNTQTVAAGALSVSPSTALSSQNIIAGSTGVTLGRFVLDTSASGENVRITSIQIRGITGTNADLDDLNSLQLFDGATALNTGSNVVNPSSNALAADANLTFTLDANALVMPKSSSKVIELKGNTVSTSTPTANTTYIFDFSAGSPDWGATGVSTGQTIAESLTTGSGATMTVVTSGALTITLDSSDPTEKWYAANSTGVTLGVFRLTGTNENLALTNVSLVLSNTASSSSADITNLYLYDGSTLIASKVNPPFTGTGSTEAFVLPTSGSGSFVVSANSFKLLTVKADLANIATGQPGVAGHLIAIATSSTATDNRSLGVQSGSAANVSGSASASTGLRYFRSVPTVTKSSLTSNVLSNGTKTLYKFTVKADSAYDAALYKFSFNVATTGDTTATSFSLKETNTGKTVNTTTNTITGGIVEILVASAQYGANWITLSAGATNTYEFQALVASASAGESITTQLEGDAAFPANIPASTFMGAAALIDADTNDDFIWSDFSSDATTTHALTTADWMNGYKVPGLPTTNLDADVLSL